MQIICKCVEIPKYDLELFHTYLKKKKTYILFCLTVFPTFLQKKGTNNDDVVLSQEKEGANSCSNFELY